MKEIREINRGGFGVVHEVEDHAGKRVARKQFSPLSVDKDQRAKLEKRFVREVRIQAQLHHPNIMPILKYDLEASPPWFAMPLASSTFRDKIASDHAAGDFDPAPWQDILAAVEELHRLGYVHRDLKPENILLVEGRWVLSDFGLVLPTARDTTILTSSRSAYGSHHYAAPEQAQDFRNTPEQADIFALGCILHDSVEWNTPRVPYAQIRTGGVYGPILEKCTAADPGRRFQRIETLRAALFDLWRTSEFPGATSSGESLLEAVRQEPNSKEDWQALLQAIEESEGEEGDALMRGIDADLISSLRSLDEVLFSRLLDALCSWASGSQFDWAYCDVVGDRLLKAHELSTVRHQCATVLAALQLAISHNRWHVMKQAGQMLASTASEGLVDRLLIEMQLSGAIAECLLAIEKEVGLPRERWHPKIGGFLHGLGEG